MHSLCFSFRPQIYEQNYKVTNDGRYIMFTGRNIERQLFILGLKYVNVEYIIYYFNWNTFLLLMFE